MTYAWATWLATALRSDPFVAARLIESPGWQSRGRPPSQFSFAPSGVLDHHTACMIRTNHDPQQCLNLILSGHSGVPGPISQLLGTWTPPGVRFTGNNVDPRIIIVAAGRSNHAGEGRYPWGAPAGNGSSIGIEWCGPSETTRWPDVVVELRERVSAAILRHNGWPISRLTTHWEYATPRGRKIDPSGPYIGQPSLRWNQPWDPQVWRNRVASRLTVTPPPQPPTPNPDPENEDIMRTIKIASNNATFTQTGSVLTWIPSQASLAGLRAAGLVTGSVITVTDDTLRSLVLQGDMPPGMNAAQFAAHRPR